MWVSLVCSLRAAVLCSGSQSMVCGHLGTPKALEKGVQGDIKTMCHNSTKTLRVFISVLTLALAVQTQLEGETSESRAHIGGVRTSRSSSPRVCHCRTHAETRPGRRMCT